MDKEDRIQEIEVEYSTAGHKKFIRYFEEIFNTKPFQETIRSLRKKHKIPENGFTGSEKIIYPPQWELTLGFHKDVKKLCGKYFLHYMDVILILEPYIFYNEVDFENIIYERGAFNLLHLADLAEEVKEPFSKAFQDSDNIAYPIAVRISPYASLRDILDYVKKTYKPLILPLQNRYKVKGVSIGKSKKRKTSIKERNNFIYQNRHLPRKKIMELITDKYGADKTVDYAYIGKIISLEQKKRKDV